MVHFYRISGLSVASDMALPGAVAVAPDSNAEIRVRFGDVPEALPEPSASGPTWQMHGNRFLLRIPNLVRVLVSGGQDIIVALEEGATAPDAAGYVLGTGFGVLLHQRGALVLHGSAVARDGQAIILCGDSRAGKSTLAAALCREGCEFVADDLCVLTPDGAGRFRVLPDGRQLKLWGQAIAHLGLSDTMGAPVLDGFDKFFVEPAANAGAPPLLSAIYVLRHGSGSRDEAIAGVTAVDAVSLLDRQTYRAELRDEIGTRAQTLTQLAAAASSVGVYLCTRSLGFDGLPGTVRGLLSHWGSLGAVEQRRRHG